MEILHFGINRLMRAIGVRDSWIQIFTKLSLVMWCYSVVGQGREDFHLPGGRKLQMTVFGDSATLAMFADTTVGFPTSGFQWNFIRAFFVNLRFGVANPLDTVHGQALLGTDKNLSFFKRTHLSALLGSQEYSLPQKLEKATGFQPVVVNAAILGGSYGTSDIHWTDINERYRQSNQVSDIVLVNYNGIDFVKRMPVGSFVSAVQGLMKEIVTTHPNSLIMMNRFVDIVGMLTRPDEIAIPNHLSYIGQRTCRDMLGLFQFGRAYGLEPGVEGARLAEARAGLLAFQSVIDEVALSIRDRRGDFINFEGAFELVYFEDAPRGRWSDYLASDCLHPNQLAQRMYAEKYWELLKRYLPVDSRL